MDMDLKNDPGMTQLMDISYPTANSSSHHSTRGELAPGSNIAMPMTTNLSGSFNSPKSDRVDDFVMPMMSREHQTLDWQQSHYMLDSGLASAMSTHTPSVCSRPGGGLDEGSVAATPYTVMPASYQPCNILNPSDSMNCMEISMGAISPNNWASSDYSAGPTSGQISAVGEERSVNNFSHNSASLPRARVQQIPHVESAGSSLDAAKHNIENLNPNGGTNGTGSSAFEVDPSVATTAIPELVHLMEDEEDPVVLNQAAIMVFQLSRSQAVDALIEHEEMLHCLLRCLDRSCNGQGMVDTVRFMTGTLYNISQRPHGLQGIYRVGAVAILVRLLSSSVESVLYYAITTLHNLLLRQDEAKQAVRDAGGVHKMVALLRKDNIKFLAICTDCLQILAYSHEATKLTMLEAGAPQLLVHILETYHYEKLLWTATRVLKVLSVCSYNKQAIIDVGGMEALTRHLMLLPSPTQVPSNPGSQGQNSAPPQMQPSIRLVLNCLWTLRNLSDAATRRDNVTLLLRTLLHLVASYTVAISASRSPTGELLFGGGRLPPEEQPHATLQWLAHTPPPNSVMLNCSLVDATNMVTCAAGILSNLTCNQRNKLQLVKEYGVHIILDCIRCHLPSPTTGVYQRGIFSVDNGVGAGVCTDLLEACVCVLRHLTSKYEAAEFAQKAVLSGGRVSVQLLVYLLALGLGDVPQQQSFPPGTQPSGDRPHQNLSQTSIGGSNVKHWPLVKATVGLLHNIARPPENVNLLRDAGLVTPLMHLLRKTEQEMASVCSASDAVASSAPSTLPRNPSQARGNEVAPQPSIQEIRLKELIELASGTVYLLIHADPPRRKQLLYDGAPPGVPLSHTSFANSSQFGGLAFFLRMLFSHHESLQLVALKILSDMSMDPQGQCAIAQSSKEVHFRLRQLSQSPRDDINTFASHILVRVSEGPQWSPSSGESFPSSPFTSVQSSMTSPQPGMPTQPLPGYPPTPHASSPFYGAPPSYSEHGYFPLGRPDVIGPSGPPLYPHENQAYPPGWNPGGNFPPQSPFTPNHPLHGSMSPKALRHDPGLPPAIPSSQSGYAIPPNGPTAQGAPWCGGSEPLSPHAPPVPSRYVMSVADPSQGRHVASLVTSGYASPSAGGTQYSSVANLPAAVAASEQHPQSSASMKWSA